MSVQLLLLLSFSSIILGVLSYSPVVYYKRSQYYPSSSYDQFCCWYYYNPSQQYTYQRYLQYPPYPQFPPVSPSFMYYSNHVNTYGLQPKRHRPIALSPPKLTSGYYQPHFPTYPMFLQFPHPFTLPQIRPVQQTSTAIIMPKISPTTTKPTSKVTYSTKVTTPSMATTVTPTTASVIPSTPSTTAKSWHFPLFGGYNLDPVTTSTSIPTTEVVARTGAATFNAHRNKEYTSEIDDDLEVEGSALMETDDEDS